MEKPKFVFFVTSGDALISHRFDLIRYVQELGFDTYVMGSLNETNVRKLKDIGVSTRRLAISRGTKDFLIVCKEIRFAIRALYDLGPSIIFCVSIKACLVGAVCRIFTRVTFGIGAITGIGSGFRAPRISYRDRFLRWASFSTISLGFSGTKGCLVFQNQSDLMFFSECSSVECSKELIAGSAISFKSVQLRDEPRGKKIVMMGSRILIDKGVFDFIEAVKIFSRLYPGRAIFRLYGDFDSENPSAISEKQLMKAICDVPDLQYLGRHERILEAIHESNIVALPSHHEGFPRILIEAFACRRAVITSNAPGCSDAVVDGYTGIIVDVKRPDLLADAFSRLVSDDKLRLNLADSGWRVGQAKFDVRPMMKAYSEVFDALGLLRLLRN